MPAITAVAHWEQGSRGKPALRNSTESGEPALGLGKRKSLEQNVSTTKAFAQVSRGTVRMEMHGTPLNGHKMCHQRGGIYF